MGGPGSAVSLCRVDTWFLSDFGQRKRADRGRLEGWAVTENIVLKAVFPVAAAAVVTPAPEPGASKVLASAEHLHCILLDLSGWH